MKVSRTFSLDLELVNKIESLKPKNLSKDVNLFLRNLVDKKIGEEDEKNTRDSER